ncbi:hypothetical protein [Streptomyces bambusae]|uniref:Right-handed parallel beta-helix repeat-containing protein n=1 Tax=Streptomyces bambusae TaxID=1550616 RepID=A0ABS6Z6F7_9ACTN|nr:hypothetical protein [Streptomyces bambusae]MBW5483151.1 hypothetical protein [Streptomyces bambusae]
MPRLRTARAGWRRLVPAVTVAVTTAAAGLAAASPASAAFIFVNCPTQNLQTAINNAAPGDILLIRGTCVGTFTIGKSLTLTGSSGATLNGNDAGRTLTVNGPTTVRVTISGLTLTGGEADNGGGLFNNGATVTLNSSTVLLNHATEAGGGIASLGTTTVNNSTVRNNSSQDGGGIVNGPGLLTVYRSTVRNNAANHFGGGMAVAGQARVVSSTITANIAVGPGLAGGGIYNFSNLTLLGNSITGNTPNNCSSTTPLAGCDLV